MKQKLMLCAALAAWIICAQATESGRERLRFDDGWKFHLLDEAVGEPPLSPLSGKQCGWG